MGTQPLPGAIAQKVHINIMKLMQVLQNAFTAGTRPMAEAIAQKAQPMGMSWVDKAHTPILTLVISLALARPAPSWRGMI